MRISLISYHPPCPGTEADGWLNPTSLGQYAMSLAQQGHQVQWVSSTDTVDVYAADLPLVTEQADSTPETCRYVVPCRLYRLQAVRLFCIDRAVWQERPLQTRLFTFLCLLQRALPCEVVHAWGAFPAAYLAVYTARFMGLPAVVSYDAQSFRHGPQRSFEWQWIARHVSRGLVASDADRERLITTSDIAPTRVQVVPPGIVEASAALVALYKSLQDPAVM